jgi:hypothetical protein
LQQYRRAVTVFIAVIQTLKRFKRIDGSGDIVEPGV